MWRAGAGAEALALRGVVAAKWPSCTMVFLRGVQVAQHFHQCGQADAEFLRHGDDVEQIAIHADAEEKILDARFEVDVGGVAAETDQQGEAQEQVGLAGAGAGLVQGLAAGC